MGRVGADKGCIHLRDLITRCRDRAFDEQARYYDRRHRIEQFKVGDLVKKLYHVLSRARVNVFEKLTPKFSGPFTVVEVISSNFYNIALTEGRLAGRYHASHL